MDFGLILNFIVLAAGFLALVKGADWFVDGAAGIADKLGVPQLVIGLTIVAMGTSAPETAVSLTAAFNDSAALAVGNIVGSNIINIFLLLGITSLICPLAVQKSPRCQPTQCSQKSTVKFEMPFVVVISIIFMFLGLGNGVFKGFDAPDGVLSRFDGFILLGLFILYLSYLFYMVKHGFAQPEEVPDGKKLNCLKLCFILIVGLALIIAGSNLTISSASKIAQSFGVSRRFIGLTIVAFGTSLPELVTCIAAALKKNADIAIGNIVGSNIFNILFVAGISSLIAVVPYQGKFFSDSLVAIFSAAVLLFCVAFNRKKVLSRMAGIVMLVFYAAYFAWLLKTV